MSFKALCDFESLGEVKITNESTDISLLTINDDIALESNDIVKLVFTPLHKQFMDDLEQMGEFVRTTAFVHIVDNDGEYCRSTYQNSGLKYFFHYAALDINFDESRYSVSERGQMRSNVKVQFRRTQESFDLTLKTVASNVDDCDMMDIHDAATDGTM